MRKKPRGAVLVVSGSRGRRASDVTDGVSLVFHVVHPVFVFLCRPPLVAYERYERVGLHSCNRFWRRGAPQALFSDVVSRIRSCISLAGLQFLDDVQEEAVSCSTPGWFSVDGPATRSRRMS